MWFTFFDFSTCHYLLISTTSLQILSCPILPNETMEPSFDVVQAIVTKLKELPGAGMNWVKGHHDREVTLDAMSTQERLNVRADKLAGQFLSAVPCTDLPPTGYPSTSHNLLL
jgi:hypothetical protein